MIAQRKGSFLHRFFSPEFMVSPQLRQDDVYPTSPMYRNFIKIAWPALVESVLMGLVTFIDSMMVSSCGEEAVAAVGLTNQPRLLFYAVFLSMSVAVNAIVSRRFGEKKQEDANRCLATVLPITVVLCALMTVLAFVVARPLLLFAGAQPDTIELAVPYFCICMVGMNFTVFSLMINVAHRACGNTRITLVTNLTANIINVAMNALLIHGLFFFPKLGVTGAAIATMIGNISTAVISLISVLRKDRYLRLRLRYLKRIDLHQLGLIFRIGSGSLVEQVFMRLGFFSYAKIVAELGTMEFATHQIVMTIITLSFTVGDGLSVAAGALVGQNLGKKRVDYALIYSRIGQRIGICLALVLSVVFLTAGWPLMRLFSDDPAIIRTGIYLLWIVALTSPFQVIQVECRGCLNGAGDTKYMAVVSFVSIALVRPVLAYILCYPVGLGVYGAWISLFLDQFTRFSLAMLRFSGSSWYKKKV